MSQNAANPQQLDVVSLNISKLGTYAVRLTNTSTYLGVTYTSFFDFNVVVVDPCINTIVTTFVIADLNVINGQTAFTSWSEATDSIQTKYNIPTLCGPRTYTLVENTAVDVTSWLALTSPTTGTYRVTATPTLDALVKTWNLTVRVRLNNYAGNAGIDVPLTVIVAGATCNCSLLTWDPPVQTTATVNVSNTNNPRTVTAPKGTVNAASKLASAAIRACGNSCPVTSTLTAT